MGPSLVETHNFKIFTLSLNNYYAITTNTLNIGLPVRELMYRRYITMLINATEPASLS
jgi:hypothetical protein